MKNAWTESEKSCFKRWFATPQLSDFGQISLSGFHSLSLKRLLFMPNFGLQMEVVTFLKDFYTMTKSIRIIGAKVVNVH
jgi:hypothetical protein